MCDPQLKLRHMESIQQDELDYARYVILAKSLNPYPWISPKSVPFIGTENSDPSTELCSPHEQSSLSIFTTPKKQKCYIPDCYTDFVETTEELCHKEAKNLSKFACVVFLSIVLALIFITSHNSVRTNRHT